MNIKLSCNNAKNTQVLRISGSHRKLFVSRNDSKSIVVQGIINQGKSKLRQKKAKIKLRDFIPKYRVQDEVVSKEYWFMKICSRSNLDETLYSALWALRTCKNEVTKYSHFELLYGRRDLQPFELTLNIQKKEMKWKMKNIEDRRKQIKRLRACYKPGDLVLVKVFNRRKLDPFFTGPREIVKQELNTVTPQGTYNCQKDVLKTG
ncbi:hypothetical protein H8356DRAFT_1326287 [Neocallimastix lanati (nom. inval.)]|nr:hypothetical protein H8356DRAFT_1326287 [Neocallimastix sp. JGI-2020a]